MVNKKTMSIAIIAMIAMMCMTGCPAGTDLSNVGATVGVESLSTPVISEELTDNGVILSWAPVDNAAYYVVYRAEKDAKGKFGKDVYLGQIPAPLNYFQETVGNGAYAIKDGTTYRYTVIAYSSKNSLKGSKGTKKVTIAVAKGTKVAAAENITAEVVLIGGELKLVVDFDVAEGLDKSNAVVSFNYSVSGLPDGVFFGTGDTLQYIDNEYVDDYDEYEDYLGKFVSEAYDEINPSFGKIIYTVTTRWSDNYFAENSVTKEYEYPAYDKTVPNIYVHECDSYYGNLNGLVIKFNDILGAEYTLYRAKNDGTYKFEKVTAEPTKVDLICDSNYGIDYTYLDTDMTVGDSFIYVLTGTLDGKALVYQDGAKETGTYDPDYDSALSDEWDDNINFTAYRFDGNDNSNDVRLSWTNLEGWEYQLVRCVVDGYSHADVDNVEADVAIDISDALLGVKVQKDDKITKTEGLDYKYTLIGTKKGVTCKSTAYVYGYYVDPVYSPVFYFGGVTGYGDGTADITIYADVSYDISTFVFYRAEQIEDEYLGNYKFTDEYKVVTLTLDSSSDAGVSVKRYTYRDTSAKKSSTRYRYDVKRKVGDELININGVADYNNYADF